MDTCNTAAVEPRRSRIRETVQNFATNGLIMLFACAWCLVASWMTNPPPADKD